MTLPGQTPGRWTMPLIARAGHLRACGMSYPDIAICLGEYHGLAVSGDAVRKMVRSHGRAGPRARGNMNGLVTRA